MAKHPHNRQRSSLHEALVGPGLQIGYEHTFIHQVADFLQALGRNEQASPTFADAAATDYVTDAVLKSARTRQWEKVE